MLSYDRLTKESEPVVSVKNKKKENVIFLTTNPKESVSHKMKDIDSDYSDGEDDNYEGQGFKSLSLDNYNQRLCLVPSLSKNMAQKWYIAGPAGSGKSTLIGNFVSDYIKLFPDKNIYLFSDVDEDPLLDKYKKIKRIKLDEEFLDNQMHPEELRNSLCIFDDIDSCQSKKILATVQTLRDSILKRGRHEEIYHIIITSHLLTNYKDTRVVLSESNYITVFPSSGALSGLNYILKNYIGLGTKEIPKIKKLKSRYVTFKCNYPKMIITENQIFLQDQLDNM